MHRLQKIVSGFRQISGISEGNADLQSVLEFRSCVDWEADADDLHTEQRILWHCMADIS